MQIHSNPNNEPDDFSLRQEQFNRNCSNNTVVTTDMLEALIESEYLEHPFSHGVEQQNLRSVMQNYFAMSQAFPYLQAGAMKDFVMSAMEQNQDIPREIEITSVVGSFLTWDEVGGHFVLSRGGQADLPTILETDKYFHANLLRSDLSKIFGESVSTDYSPETVEYLKELSDGLSSLDNVERCAHMVAFELHAERMINSLWESLQNHYQGDKDDLIYFKAHVGGDDPAEAYHTMMTQRMIELLIEPQDKERFIEAFSQAYRMNHNWCEAIKHLDSGSSEGRAS